MILACSLSIGFLDMSSLRNKTRLKEVNSFSHDGNVNMIIMLKRSIFFAYFHIVFTSSQNEPTAPTNALKGENSLQKKTTFYTQWK
jgi:hypothetical protein